jgi:sugar lactone lactonase YvrE
MQETSNMSEQEFEAFAPGDVLVGATRRNNSADDHAGQGRILQYDAQLNLKATCLVPDTTHVIAGLAFDPRGALWAFDYQAHKVLCFDAQGRRTPSPDLGSRSYSNVLFCRDGSTLLGEHLVGSESRVALGTQLLRDPSTGRFGDGHVFRFDSEGRLLAEYATQTHGGMGGFLGVTMTALSADERTLYYVSETGPRLMRYDLAADRQLPDLVDHSGDPRQMFFDLCFLPDGRLVALRGDRLEVLDPQDGALQDSHALPGFGWATLCACADNDSVLATNFFTGELLRYSLGERRVMVQAAVDDAKRSLAGIAEVPA